MKSMYGRNFKGYAGIIASIILVLFIFVFISPVQTYSQEEPFVPETLSLTPGNTEADLNITWYADKKEGEVTKVRIRDNAGGGEKEFGGTVTRVEAGRRTHKASITGLEPNKEYSYRVSNDGESWSTAYSYKTADEKSFRFAFVGDPQLNTLEQDSGSKHFSSDKTVERGWKETVKKISTYDVSFIASAGDQVDDGSGSEREYRRFFSPSELKNIPYAPVVGNHDRHYLFQYHFNLPNEQKFEPVSNKSNGGGKEKAAVEAAGNYWYSYNNALFVVLNTSASPDSAEAAKPYIDRFDKTLAAAIEANKGKYDWLFVQHHKSTRTIAAYASNKNIGYYVEAGFEKLMDKYDVDFVLAGHDHVYARTYALKGGKPVEGATVYITGNSSSGTKYYDITSKSSYIKVGAQNKKPAYSIFDIKGNLVTYKAYDVDSDAAFDSFSVAK